MEFDKSKVFTALNADEIELGSKGYYADTIKDLKETVEQDYAGWYGEIEKITEDCYSSRFKIKDDSCFNFFYLVEKPKENRFRPYSNPDEMIEDFKKRYSSYGGWSGKDNPMYNPLIWVKSKRTGNQRLITVLNSDNNCVRLGSISAELRELFEDYVYLDGSPCGIEE